MDIARTGAHVIVLVSRHCNFGDTSQSVTLRVVWMSRSVDCYPDSLPHV